MTPVSQTNGSNGLAASSTGAATTNADSFNADFETFLTLLTTQLQQQDPLSPMDTDKFTQQLVQFSQVEQSIKTNSNLANMIEMMQIGAMTEALDYVGKWVELEGNQLSLSDEGSANFGYELAEAADNVSVTIRNSDGRLVATLDGETKPGTNALSWNGLDDAGRRLPAGTYRLSIDASDADGEAIDVTTRVGGTVDSIERSGGQLALVVDGVPQPLSSVLSVRPRNDA